MWKATPGEFNDLLAGRVEADRDRRLFAAFAACAWGGDPFKLIGERSPEPTDPNQSEGWTKDSPEADKDNRLETMAKIERRQAEDRAEEHRRWAAGTVGWWRERR